MPQFEAENLISRVFTHLGKSLIGAVYLQIRLLHYLSADVASVQYIQTGEKIVCFTKLNCFKGKFKCGI